MPGVTPVRASLASQKAVPYWKLFSWYGADAEVLEALLGHGPAEPFFFFFGRGRTWHEVDGPSGVTSRCER